MAVPLLTRSSSHATTIDGINHAWSGAQVVTRAWLSMLRHPLQSARMLDSARRGFDFGRQWDAAPVTPSRSLNGAREHANPLREYFDANASGPGIFKWLHYFDTYHRHFAPFVGREVNVLEIGVLGGGSLGMWRSFFGSRCRIVGVDIDEACRKHESEHVKVFIGDQADRDFWRRFRAEAPPIDILIDDGGHTPEQQIVTLEEMLPHLRPGGVYVCEDIHNATNRFSHYLGGLAAHLNAFESTPTARDGDLESAPTSLQAAIASIHLYPFVAVIERTSQPAGTFHAPRHGTEWPVFNGEGQTRVNPGSSAQKGM